MIGRINAPAQSSRGLLRRGFVCGRAHQHTLAVNGGGRARAISAFGLLLYFGHHADFDQSRDTLFDEDRFGSRAPRRFIRQRRLAFLRFVERVDFGDGARDALPQALFLSFGKSQ